jgi:hypothetical protein
MSDMKKEQMQMSTIEDWISINVRIDDLIYLISNKIINVNDFEEIYNEITNRINNSYWKTKNYLMKEDK